MHMTTTPDISDTWVLVDSVAGRKLMVQNLTSKSRYYFKVVAVGTAGNADASDLSSQIAA